MCCVGGHTGHGTCSMSRPGTRVQAPAAKRAAAVAMQGWLATASDAAGAERAARAEVVACSAMVRPAAPVEDPPRSRRRCLRPPRVTGRRSREEFHGRRSEDNDEMAEEMPMAGGQVEERRKKPNRGQGVQPRDPHPPPGENLEPPPSQGMPRLATPAICAAAALAAAVAAAPAARRPETGQGQGGGGAKQGQGPAAREPRRGPYATVPSRERDLGGASRTPPTPRHTPHSQPQAAPDRRRSRPRETRGPQQDSTGNPIPPEQRSRSPARQRDMGGQHGS